jgi:anti-sigma B factor antagonist
LPAVPPEFSFTVRDLPGVHIVALTGELDMDTAQGLSEELTAIAGSTVVVDLADLTFMDSSGISAVVTARNRIGQAGDELVVSRPQRTVRRVLEITGLSGLIADWADEWS